MKKKATKIAQDADLDSYAFARRYVDVLAPNSLVYRMKLLTQLIERRFQQMLEPYHLTPLHWAVLCCLWQSDGLPTVALGSRLGQLRGTLVVALDGMEKAGYLARKQDVDDQRISRIFLTRRGRKLRSELPAMAQNLQREAFRPLSSSEIELLSKQLDLLLNESGGTSSRLRHPKPVKP